MYDSFKTWLDETWATSDIPEDAIALNFNIYEDGDNLWSVELVACNTFTPGDNDWAADEVFAARENPFEWEEETAWQEIQDKVLDWIKDYLTEEKYAEEMKAYDGIGAGFVDGDVEILHING